LGSYKILHVAAHYGGGVGTIIQSWINNDDNNYHKLTYLNDIPENETKTTELFDPGMIPYHDFIIVHVWNHPALFEFLVKSNLSECRMIGWAHMSGLHAPYILFDKLINYFDDFYFTSPISNLTGIHKDFIWSSCDINQFINLPKIPHDTFNIGYIGTLDYCKLHPDFIKICNQLIDIPNVKFIIIGSGCNEQQIKQEVQNLGLNDKFEFVGSVTDIKPYLSKFDVFLYPLYEKHFGTCEQVLGEAMASGLHCIVLNNPSEKEIINSYINGFIMDDSKQIIHIITMIYKKMFNTDFYSVNAIQSAKDKYSIDSTLSKWNAVFEENIIQNKKMRSWNGTDNIFIESLGPVGEIFKDYVYHKSHGNTYDLQEFVIPQIKQLFHDNRQWYSDNKGSIKQYARYFPEDQYLKEWLKLL